MKGTTNVSEPRLPRHSSPADGGGLTIAGLLMAGALVLSPQNAATAAHAAEIPKHQQAFAHCVAMRESHGNARAKGDKSSARGRWQFLDKQWRKGLSHMVAERLVHFGMGAHDAKRVRVHLASVSIDKWSGTLQDVAFVAALNARGPWSGAHHWHLPGSKCNRLVGSVK